VSRIPLVSDQQRAKRFKSEGRQVANVIFLLLPLLES